MIKKLLYTICFAIISNVLNAQEKVNGAEMADTFRSNGKIYVVIAVILTIFAGIIIYLIRLDRKMSRIEKEYHQI
jgi:uncharacterized membrane protein